ncbi:hypothetical protein [Edwardsiella tarda]|uniref:hypothetical protein n=1 Tax=Edwardsiella tarda TaxID=636 RepID=UPI00351C7DD4
MPLLVFYGKIFFIHLRLVEVVMSAWVELGLSEEEFNDLNFEWFENTGSSGEATYGFFSYIPEHTPEEILQRNGWSVGNMVEVSLNAFDDEEEWLCPNCMNNPCECAEMDRYISEQVYKSDRDDKRRS